MFFLENRACASALLEGSVKKKKLRVTFNESSSVFLSFVLGTVRFHLRALLQALHFAS